MANYYGEDLALIRYHVPWFGNDPYYNYNTTENMARNNYYGNSYTPHFFIDGNVDGGSNRNAWNGMISNELNVSSPLDIDIAGTYDPVTREGDLEITVIATAQISYSNLRLRIAITESRLYWHAPNGSDWHNQTFRDMIPNTAGIFVSISQGETLSFNQSFSLDPQLDDNNCEIVVFVQSDSGYRILQGAKTGVTSLQIPYDLTPFSLISPPDTDTIFTCNPNFVWHSSDDPDSGYPVSYQVEYAMDPGFSNPLPPSEWLSDTSWTTPLCLIGDSTYYWRVLASNGHAPDRYSEEVFSFTVIEFGRIAGTVTDENYIPIEDVFVDLLNSEKDDSTDASGNFSLDSLFTGTYEILLSHPDYLDTTITDIIVASAETTFLDIILYEDPGCPYTVGDANDSGDYNGLDITYGVNFFKGGAPPPYVCECTPGDGWYVAGDVNASCSYNGLDITYGVNYFKGGSDPTPCPDCPPAP